MIRWRSAPTGPTPWTGSSASTSTGCAPSGWPGSRPRWRRPTLGALLTFDFSNIRYMTATHIGTWAMDKLIRFAVLPRGGEPVLWDFGSAAKHHQLFNPWLDGTERARAGISTLRGAFHPDAGIAEEVARKVATVLREHGLDERAARRRPGRDADPGRAAGRGHRRRRRPAGLPRGPPDQDRRRDQPAHPGLLDGGRGVRRALLVPAPGRARERVRRPGQQGALRPRQRVRRGRQRDLRRALLAAPARLQRPRRPARRPGVLRHPAQPPRLPHLLLPLLRGRAPRPRRCATPTPAAGSTWTPRSRS